MPRRGKRSNLAHPRIGLGRSPGLRASPSLHRAEVALFYDAMLSREGTTALPVTNVQPIANRTVHSLKAGPFTKCGISGLIMRLVWSGCCSPPHACLDNNRGSARLNQKEHNR